MKKLKKSVKYLVMFLISIVILIPIAWTIVSSLKPELDIVSYPPKWIPDTISLSNYETVLGKYPYLSWAKNSLITAGAGTVLILILSSMAAYAFARFTFRGKKLLYGMVVIMLLIPIQAYMIPLFLLSSKIGLINKSMGVILPSVANVTSIFILTSFFKDLPNELEEAARIDGCKEMTIFSKIMLPLSKPALSTVTIIAFISNWNSFLWPMLVLRSDKLLTLPVGISQYMGNVGSNAQFQYGPVLAACCMAVIPTLIIFLFLQRYFVEGIANTGIKG